MSFLGLSSFGKQPTKRMDVANEDLERATTANVSTPDDTDDVPTPAGMDSSGDLSHGEWVKKP